MRKTRVSNALLLHSCVRFYLIVCKNFTRQDKRMEKCTDMLVFPVHLYPGASNSIYVLEMRAPHLHTYIRPAPCDPASQHNAAV